MLNKTQPYVLTNVPSGMERFVYEEERTRGSVTCPANVYMLVLALRWTLYEYHEADWYNSDDYVTWKVLWKPKDDYGLETEIYLFRDHVMRWDMDGLEQYVAQEQAYLKLASVHCQNDGGKGDIRNIRIEGGPYGYTLLDEVAGITRLLEDAFGRNKRTGDILPDRRDNSLIMREYRDYTDERLTVTWQLDGIAIAELSLKYEENVPYWSY